MARTSASARALTDHDEIRRWAEERNARPSCVRGTGKGGDVGMIRLDFPGYTGENSLEEISWDDWFQKFDESSLALLVQDTTARGQKSNFNKLVSRETAEEREDRRGSQQTRSRSNGRGRSAATRSGSARSESRRSGSRSSSGSRSRAGRKSRSSGSKTASKSGSRSRSSGTSRSSRSNGSSRSKSSRSNRSASTRSQSGNRSSRRKVVIEVECAPGENRTERSRTTGRSSSGKKSSPRASSRRRGDRAA